jgi:hypothetical protein
MSVSTENGLKRYAIRYRDPDPACPIFVWYTKAYNRQHARDRFVESCGDDGWEDAIVESIVEVKP